VFRKEDEVERPKRLPVDGRGISEVLKALRVDPVETKRDRFLISEVAGRLCATVA